ncbi:ESX secretion-associated protein EspG [Actinosynnema sp. CA-299493]
MCSAVRTPGGRKRIERPVNYVDTANGRWLVLLADTSGGWATAAPATPALIALRLREAADALEAGGAPGFLGDPHRK